jgi:hypothetical protein
MLRLYQAYPETGTGLVTGWVEILTGRSPRTFEGFAREHSGAFQSRLRTIHVAPSCRSGWRQGLRFLKGME